MLIASRGTSSWRFFNAIKKQRIFSHRYISKSLFVTVQHKPAQTHTTHVSGYWHFLHEAIQSLSSSHFNSWFIHNAILIIIVPVWFWIELKRTKHNNCTSLLPSLLVYCDVNQTHVLCDLCAGLCWAITFASSDIWFCLIASDIVCKRNCWPEPISSHFSFPRNASDSCKPWWLAFDHVQNCFKFLTWSFKVIFGMHVNVASKKCLFRFKKYTNQACCQKIFICRWCLHVSSIRRVTYWDSFCSLSPG